MSGIEFKLGNFLPTSIVRILRTIRNNSHGVDVLQTRDFYRISQILKFFGEVWSTQDILRYAYRSESELQQDLVAMLLTKRPGFFVEFGACDGIFASNTYSLEKNLNWTGILCEPIFSFSSSLLRNRNCTFDSRVVSGSSGMFLEFQEATEPNLSGLLESLAINANKAGIAREYLVESISLEDLLAQHGAPNLIDFLSIDTEGSEFEIIKNFDFDKYTFTFICIEHNFSSSESLVENHLVSKGYCRILTELSGGDAWYIQNSSKYIK